MRVRHYARRYDLQRLLRILLYPTAGGEFLERVLLRGVLTSQGLLEATHRKAALSTLPSEKRSTTYFCSGRWTSGSRALALLTELPLLSHTSSESNDRISTVPLCLILAPGIQLHDITHQFTPIA